MLDSGKFSTGVPGVSRAQHGRLSPRQGAPSMAVTLKDPQKILISTQELKFPSVFSVVCSKGRRAGGLSKAPTPVPPLPYHFPMSAFLFSYTPPPHTRRPSSARLCYFLLPLLLLPSSVVFSVFTLPLSLNVPQGPRSFSGSHRPSIVSPPPPAPV